MKTSILYPQNEILKNFIQYFLFIEKEEYGRISQICYPNTNHCLSLMKSSQIYKFSESNYQILSSEIHSSYLTGIYKFPINICADIPYKELCINFNPLGLEAFFGEKLSSIIFKKNPLNFFDPSWKSLFEIAFSTNSINDIQKEIETFFINKVTNQFIKYQDFNLNRIENFNRVEDISDIIYKSYRSTNRFFKEQFQITPKDFLQIKKVRNAMDLLFENKSITEISYDLNFTDQSHLIKTFKNYTQLTPLQFRKTAMRMDNNLIWRIQ